MDVNYRTMIGSLYIIHGTVPLGENGLQLRPMYGEMNNGWGDGGAVGNCNPCLTKLKSWPYPYPWILSHVTFYNSQKMAEHFFHQEFVCWIRPTSITPLKILWDPLRGTALEMASVGGIRKKSTWDCQNKQIPLRRTCTCLSAHECVTFRVVLINMHLTSKQCVDKCQCFSLLMYGPIIKLSSDYSDCDSN